MLLPVEKWRIFILVWINPSNEFLSWFVTTSFWQQKSASILYVSLYSAKMNASNRPMTYQSPGTNYLFLIQHHIKTENTFAVTFSFSCLKRKCNVSICKTVLIIKPRMNWTGLTFVGRKVNLYFPATVATLNEYPS